MHRRCLSLCLVAAVMSGCIHVKMDPIQINAVVDVNLKVEREVAGLLTDIYGSSTTINAATAPAPVAK